MKRDNPVYGASASIPRLMSGSPRTSRISPLGRGLRTGSPPQPEAAKSAHARDGFSLVKNLNAISRMSPPLFVGQQMEVCINAVEHGSE